MGDVSDKEWLHRCVAIADCQSVQPRRLSSTAFNDRFRKPSVDQASLRPAIETQFAPTDGVVRLLTESVRKIGIEMTPPPESGPKNYEVDVWARPEPNNNAHAQIEPLPHMTDARFKKLKEALALLAAQEDWVIVPRAAEQAE